MRDTSPIVVPVLTDRVFYRVESDGRVRLSFSEPGTMGLVVRNALAVQALASALYKVAGAIADGVKSGAVER